VSKTLLLYFKAEEHISVSEFLTDIGTDFSIVDFRTNEFVAGELIVFYFTPSDKNIFAYDYIRESDIDNIFIYWEDYKQQYYRKDKIERLVDDEL